MATAAVEDESFVWKAKWPEVMLDKPAGSWFDPTKEYDLDNGYCPATPLNTYAARYGAASAKVPLAQHSDDPKTDPTDPEWRRLHLTIGGLAEMQQQKEVAMGRHADGVVNPFALILADSLFPLGMRLDMKATDLWDTSALGGKRPVIAQETVEHLVSAQAQEIWDELVPTKKIDINTPDMVFWTNTQYMPAMASETTPMGMPTMVSSRAWTDRQTLSLFSIGGRITVAFWKTEMGSKHWWEILTQMASGIVAAGQFASAVAISAAPEKFAKVMKDNVTHKKPTFDQVFDNLQLTFAISQRPHHAWFNILMKRLDEIRVTQNGEQGPYVLATTKEAGIALATGCQDGINYSVSGPDGPMRLNMPIMTKGKFYTTDMYLISAFDMPSGKRAQPWAKPFSVGERFDMFTDKQVNTSNAQEFKDALEDMDRRVYTHPKEWVPVTWQDAVSWAAVYDTKESGGAAIPPNGKPVGDDNPPSYWKYSKVEYPHLYDYYPWFWAPKDVAEGGEWTLHPDFPRTRDGALAGIDIGVDGKDVKIGDGIGGRALKTMQIMGYQIDQRGTGHSAFYMLPGRVVFRLRKEGHIMVEDNFEQHVHQVQAQYKQGCAIVNPQDCVEVPNFYVNQTEKNGYGTEPIHPNAGHWSKNYNPNRLQGGQIGDVVYVAVPPNPYYRLEHVPTNVNLVGYIEGDLAKEYLPESGHKNDYPGCRYYDSIYGWSDQRCGCHGQRTYKEPTYRSKMVDLPVNICVRQMTYQQWDHKTKSWKYYKRGKGYWGFDGTYEGALDARNAGCFLKDPDRGKEYDFK